MSKEINNDHPFASTAVDDGYHSQHRLNGAKHQMSVLAITPRRSRHQYPKLRQCHCDHK
jgi:hypothetical protein